MPVHRHQRYGLEVYHPLHQARGGLTTENGSKPGMFLEHDSPRHDLADNHCVPLMGYATFSNGGTARMQAHADLKRRCVGARMGPLASRQLPLDVQGRKHRALRMILLRHRGTKDDQGTISSYSPEQAAILLSLMACQLMQCMQPMLPGCQAALLTLDGGGHQHTTQDRDHFPLTHREHVSVREGDAGRWQAERVQGRWRGMASHRSTRW